MILLCIYFAGAFTVTAFIAYDLVHTLAQFDDEPDVAEMDYIEDRTIRRLLATSVWPLCLFFAAVVALVLFAYWVNSQLGSSDED